MHAYTERERNGMLKMLLCTAASTPITFSTFDLYGYVYGYDMSAYAAHALRLYILGIYDAFWQT